jgi:squalene-hopene/tetraprenyl-beta-curcumene cyclase
MPAPAVPTTGFRPEALAARLQLLQAGWPPAVRLDLGGAANIYDYHPYLFAPAFPGLDERALESLAVAARLFASFIFLSDEAIDGAADPAFRPVAPLRTAAMQYEAYQLLNQLFAAGSSFWPRFGGYLRDLADSCNVEAEFGSGRRPWRQFTEEMARSVAIKKAAIAKASVAGLAALAGDESRVALLNSAVDNYNVAHQLFDDLGDWKKDLRRRQPSLVLARLLPDGGPFGSEAAGPEVVGGIARQLYYEGHAGHVLGLALLELGEADRALAGMPPLPFADAVAGLRRRCLELEADIARIVAENATRVRTQPELSVAAPALAGRDWAALAWTALEHTLTEWRRGFGEARHLMNFPWDQGFSGATEIQTGDVFQRTLLAEALGEAANLVGPSVQPAVAHEITYVLGRAQAQPPGGWSYFPELPELPADADDLAQVIRLLCQSGRRGQVSDCCEAPLQALLQNGSHPDGSLESWILPAELRLQRQQRQARFVELAWGTGPDPEVMANLLHALHVYDPERFAGPLARGLDFIEGVQAGDGSWSSTWYHGPFYGVYVATRALAAARAESGSLPRALGFVRDSQLPDGGWGVGGSADALSSSLALLALALAPAELAAASDRGRAERARDWLAAAHRAEGWTGCPFIQMNLGRAAGGPVKTIFYSSRTITTAFVLRAALAWDEREASALW